MTDDVRKLLGGFATGTLSEAERQTLFDAALQDDELFAALADEQALKDLLEDGTVRAKLLRATEEPQFSVATALREWFEAPKSKALIAIGCLVFTLIAFKELRPVAQKTIEVAEVRAPAAAPSTPESPALAPPAAKPTRIPPARKQAAPTPPEDRMAEADRPLPQPPAIAPAQPGTPPAGGVVGGIVGGTVAEPEMRASSRQMRMADQAAPVAAATPAPPPIPLGWELLRRDADGEFRPVARDHEFVAGDLVRVRVRAARKGAVALSIPGQPTLVGSVEANEPASVPETGGIVIASVTNKIVLGFAVSSADSTANKLFRREVAKAKEVAPQSLTIEIPIRHRNQ